jgi:hypothetical protein
MAGTRPLEMDIAGHARFRALDAAGLSLKLIFSESDVAG